MPPSDFVRIIVLAGGRLAHPVSSPLHPLQSLGGYHPMICVLLTTLLSLQLPYKYSVHVIVEETQTIIFEKTIHMWFPDAPIHLFGSRPVTSSDALRELFSKEKEWDAETPCLVLSAQHVLLTRMTLERFLAFSYPKHFVIAGMKRSKWNKDRHLWNVHVDEFHRVQEIEDDVFEEIGYIPLPFGKKRLWDKYLPFTQKIREVVSLLPIEEKPILYLLHSFPLETDSLSVRTEEDKVLASHKFLEKHHADYLNQCYFIWSECKRLEERIQKLETLSLKQHIPVEEH